MIISDIKSCKIGSQTEISALIDDYRLWYRFPDRFIANISAEPFLAAAFFPAAKSGTTLQVEGDEGASPRLIDNFARLQQIFGCWKPDLKPFSVNVKLEVAPPRSRSVCSFFSGGVDGLFTLINHEKELTDLLYINGFDFQLPTEDFLQNVERARQLVAPFGKPIIPVETNFYEFERYHGIGRYWSHGSCLASVALAMGVSRVIVPTSYTYSDLRPWGTHPLTDNLWSTEATEIIHDAAVSTRSEKIRAISRHQQVLDNLLVCWNFPDRNCGNCFKCMRTMTILRILNVNTKAFPRVITPKEVSSLAPTTHNIRDFEDMLNLAVEEQDNAMEQALRRAMSQNALKKLVKILDKSLLGNSLKHTVRRFVSR